MALAESNVKTFAKSERAIAPYTPLVMELPNAIRSTVVTPSGARLLTTVNAGREIKRKERAFEYW